jgi:hypothetical protein
MTRTYEEVIQRMGQSMYHRYMAGGSLYELDGVELVSFIYGVPMLQVRADAYEVYEAQWPANEAPA